jgi:hypothetical protein
MQAPKEATTTLIFRSVPVKQAVVIRQFVYNLKYQNDEKDNLAYAIIKENPNISLSKLQYQLRKEHGIHKRASKLKKIALDCGLPFTE